MKAFLGKVTVPLSGDYKQTQLAGYSVSVLYKVPRAVLFPATEQNSAPPPRKQFKIG